MTANIRSSTKVKLVARRNVVMVAWEGPEGGLSKESFQFTKHAQCFVRIRRRNSGSKLLTSQGRVRPVPDYYRHLLAFIFAVREINLNSDILPNVTLGYHLFDSCGDVNKAVESVLWILSGPGNMVPNYSCRRHGKLAGVIGDLSSQTSQQVATILNVYGYPQRYLRRINFKDPTGKDIYFNENGEMPAAYDIKNYIVITDKFSYIIMKSVGTINLSASDGEQLTINKSRIIWKYNSTEVPHSRCSEDCPPGYRRVSQESIHTCCFDCVLCSEGEVTNPTETGSCQECPGDKWPNMEKNECIYKPIEYLSFQDDGIALALALVSVLLSLIASIILCIFALFRDTPIVKANNQNLSFVLLVAIMLSFLSVFLFLGRPVDITCMLRQTSFGIIFSVAVSALLAKTFMVCIAFKATKPGSCWRKWIGAKLPNCIVFVCSFLMFLICVTWLSVSPPFQEMNTHSYPGKIIIQCNEGSVIAFYTVLSYMGFLAAVSFVVAFLARKLPDSFNEAKYITFSMLVFCNVWITFIPAYMSVMGKNTVIIEVFAILASSAGILCCIFFPKCYIILLRPQLNTKRNLHKASS
uniref:G-protein coupled receptors family 3 profile domain-containing protein n=1 Tax=Leptobrachium leishanense TaxID=445787 RepID=A0A8C5PKL1_9ANUR